MAKKNYTKLLETVIDYNDHQNAPLSNGKLQQAISTVTTETEEEEPEAKRNSNNMTMDNFCQSPATTNIQRKNTNIPNERQITLDILAEMLNVLTLHSTIINSAYYNTELMIVE